MENKTAPGFHSAEKTCSCCCKYHSVSVALTSWVARHLDCSYVDPVQAFLLFSTHYSTHRSIRLSTHRPIHRSITTLYYSRTANFPLTQETLLKYLYPHIFPPEPSFRSVQASLLHQHQVTCLSSSSPYHQLLQSSNSQLSINPPNPHPKPPHPRTTQHHQQQQ